MNGDDFFEDAVLGLVLLALLLSVFWFAIGILVGWLIFG